MKVVFRNISRFTDADLTNIESQIQAAQAEYTRYLQEYNDGMARGDTSYATRVRWPRVTKAKEAVDTLLAMKSEMLSSISKEQSINIINTTVDKATTETQTSFPWLTVGLAVGALIVIVIIVKLV